METWLADNIWAIWLAVAVLLVIFEMLSGELVLLMFGVAAALSSAESAIGLDYGWTIASFAVISAVLLYFVRPPIVARLHAGPTLPTVQERLIGASGVVTQQVTAYDGRVLVDDDDWTARSATEQPLPVGTEVTVTRTEGVTLVVKEK